MPVKSALIVLVMVVLAGCTQKEKVPKRFYPRNDHEAYWHSLKQANLLNTALGSEWVKAAEKPFEEQVKVELPYQEAFLLSPEHPDAIGYRFDAKRGQRILVDVSVILDDSTHIFLDLFRVENDSLKDYFQVASADSALQLGFEPRKDASYILRLQPELLRGGEFTVNIESVPTLAFPVAGKDGKAIFSVFGDPRDGGRRVHHGVDIFAKRHTPIIAPVEAEVRFVGTRGIGGRVVWLYDTKRGNHLYFAHLQEQLVNSYDKVYPGDTIGTVGNTGNAIRTPPHLHFGIYKYGPIDPYHFIVQQHKSSAPFKPDTVLLGRDIQLASGTFLKSEMSLKADVKDTVTLADEIKIVAVNHHYVRVKKDDGTLGFLHKDELAP